MAWVVLEAKRARQMGAEGLVAYRGHTGGQESAAIGSLSMRETIVCNE